MNVSHLLTDRVSFKAPSGLDSYGDPTLGSLTTLAARVEYDVKHVASSGGVRRDQVTRVLTTTEIPIGSLLWLPGTDTAQVNQAKTVDNARRASLPGGASLFEAVL